MAQDVGTLDERRRWMSVRLYGLDRMQDEIPSDELDRIAVVARDATGAEHAGINLLVDDVQLTVGTTGRPVPPLPRAHSICSTVLRAYPGVDVVVIPDLREVAPLRDNPFVDGSIGTLRFYAAAPLTGKHGLALGTLCVWSERRHELDATRRAVLRNLGRAVVNVLDERRRLLVPDVAGSLRPAPAPA